MIYCFSMIEIWFYDLDKNVIWVMMEFFGKDLWKKVVVVLNFVNRISDFDEEDELVYFMNEKYFWNKVIDEFFFDFGIDCKVCDVILVVLMGIYKKFCFLICENWFFELWISCYSVMSDLLGLIWY